MNNHFHTSILSVAIASLLCFFGGHNTASGQTSIQPDKTTQARNVETEKNALETTDDLSLAAPKGSFMKEVNRNGQVDYELPVGTSISGGKHQKTGGKSFSTHSLELLRPESGLLSESIVTAVGQYVVDTEQPMIVLQTWIVLSANKITALRDTEISLLIDDKAVHFNFYDSTKIYSDGKPIKKDDLKIGDTITIATKWDTNVAVSITRGPIQFGGNGTVNAKWLKGIGFTEKLPAK